MEFEHGLEHLNKTWFIDLDGTLVEHNGFRSGRDTLLPTTIDFFNNVIGVNDYVIITTARDEQYREMTLKFLEENGIKFNQIIFGLPVGIRILINDNKPDGTKTAYSLNLDRDKGIIW